MLAIHLVAIDLDGTLLHDDFTLSKQNETWIRLLHQNGIGVVLATGRGPTSCRRIYETLKINDPLIVHNGAVLFDPQQGEALNEVGFSVRELIPVMEFCRERRIHFDVNTALTMYVDHLPPEAVEMYQKFDIEPVVMEQLEHITEPVVKFTMFASADTLDHVMADIELRFPQWRILRSGEWFIDMMHHQATKGDALQRLCTSYGLAANQVMAFGNYYNDVEMIRFAGIGVAMANAPTDIQKIADQVAPSNNENGVAHVLEQHFKSDLQF